MLMWLGATYGYRRDGGHETPDVPDIGACGRGPAAASGLGQSWSGPCRARWAWWLASFGPGRPPQRQASGPIPALVDWGFVAAVMGAKMVSDITYIPESEG